jgi:hypothetical protein
LWFFNLSIFGFIHNFIKEQSDVGRKKDLNFFRVASTLVKNQIFDFIDNNEKSEKEASFSMCNVSELA